MFKRKLMTVTGIFQISKRWYVCIGRGSCNKPIIAYTFKPYSVGDVVEFYYSFYNSRFIIKKIYKGEGIS